MRSKQLDLNKYPTDKIESHYLEKYDAVFGPLADKKIDLLELGIKDGASLDLWQDYFPLGAITGIDIVLPYNWRPGSRTTIFEGSQSDTEFLSKVANQMAPQWFDIVIDDASHIGELTKIAFWHLFDKHLKPGGWYVIEDWGTGYWDDFPDGKSLDPAMYDVSPPSEFTFWKKVQRKLGFKTPKYQWPGHNYGMVGLVKQLIDEQAASDVSRNATNTTPRKQSKFKQMIITTGIVFIQKQD